MTAEMYVPKLGDYLFLDASIYKVSRITPKRAYLAKVTLKVTAHCCIGAYVNGSYAEPWLENADGIEHGFRCSGEYWSIIPLPHITNDDQAHALIERVRQSVAPFEERLAELRAAQVGETKRQGDALLAALRG